jgi:hypothetical protein
MPVVRANFPRGEMSRSARARELLAEGLSTTEVARRLDWSTTNVAKARRYEAQRAGLMAKGTVERTTYDVGVDDLLAKLKAHLPNGYEDAPGSPPVDHNRALAWLRRNPPPHHAAPRL